MVVTEEVLPPEPLGLVPMRPVLLVSLELASVVGCITICATLSLFGAGGVPPGLN